MNSTIVLNDQFREIDLLNQLSLSKYRSYRPDIQYLRDTKMIKILLAIALAGMLTECSGVLEKQQPVCSGTALIGGQETSVQIYGVRKVTSQTQYKAGDPFGWRWVSRSNFTTTTSEK